MGGLITPRGYTAFKFPPPCGTTHMAIPSHALRVVIAQPATNPIKSAFASGRSWERLDLSGKDAYKLTSNRAKKEGQFFPSVLVCLSDTVQARPFGALD